ncbi:MAG: hypothetical protein B7X48_03170 [Acidiphilium sp. 34-60-192]|nr:MAG: hypothetical protein B7X48_03170 [Acidiphilium sp. 34-60-192]
MTLLRWYFAIDSPGSTGPVGDHARLAVLSARMVGGLDPFMLYHGAEGEFCAWMRAQGVTIIHAEPYASRFPISIMTPRWPSTPIATWCFSAARA